MSKAVITLMILACASSTAGQHIELENIIRQLDQKNAFIVARTDTTAMAALMAPDFTINRSTGTVVSGLDKTLALFRHGTVSYDSFVVETDFVLIKSATLAISMGSEVVVLGGAKGQVVRRRFTHVWTKDTGTWQLLARHANNICSQ